MTTYALAGNGKFYNKRLSAIDLIVLHVTAGLEDLDQIGIDSSAEATNRYGATTSRSASWHVCVDSDSIAPALPDSYTAWHCKGYNSESLGLEISNRDARWDNKPKKWIESTLRNAAKVCHEWERAHKIPRQRLSKAQVDAGGRGYSYHMFLDPSRRRDPGETFPWDQFVGYLEELDRTEGTPTPFAPPAAPAPPKGSSPLTGKSNAQLAQEVIDGKHGSGEDRKRSLGGRYKNVQAEVNRILSNRKPAPSKPAAPTTSPDARAHHIDLLARKVIDGKYGTGDARRRALGTDYNAVQARVNQILGSKNAATAQSTINRLATEVLAGKHGSGADRKRRLGSNYAAVQAEVNRRLR